MDTLKKPEKDFLITETCVFRVLAQRHDGTKEWKILPFFLLSPIQATGVFAATAAKLTALISFDFQRQTPLS
jgi:hypothetical protein